MRFILRDWPHTQVHCPVLRWMKRTTRRCHPDVWDCHLDVDSKHCPVLLFRSLFFPESASPTDINDHVVTSRHFVQRRTFFSTWQGVFVSFSFNVLVRLLRAEELAEGLVGRVDFAGVGFCIISAAQYVTVAPSQLLHWQRLIQKDGIKSRKINPWH